MSNSDTLTVIAQTACELADVRFVTVIVDKQTPVVVYYSDEAG